MVKTNKGFQANTSTTQIVVKTLTAAYPCSFFLGLWAGIHQMS